VRGSTGLYVIRTSDWKILDLTLTAQKPGDLSFAFTRDSHTLLVSKTGFVQCIPLRSSAELPFAIQVGQAHQIYVSEDRHWIGAVTNGNPEPRIEFWETGTGGRAKLAETTQLSTTLTGKLRGRPDSQPKWILMWPWSYAAADALSGDSHGGVWTLVSDDRGTLTIRETGTTLSSNANSWAISRQGNWIAVAPRSGGVLLWPWGRKELIDHVCELLPRNFTRKEWANYQLETFVGPFKPTCEKLPSP
jgi:hypothetical protein